MILIDLHLHSVCSDGMLTPEQLAKMAKRSGVSVLSLTDHDTVEGVSSFLKNCSKYGLKGLSGVELSAEFDSTMHILGYGFDPHNSLLLSELHNIRLHRKARNMEIIDRLRDIGIDITMEEVISESSGDVVARPHFARVLIRKGYGVNMRDCFDKYLKKGKPGYVSRVRLSPQKCIELVNKAGGKTALAHPVQTTLDPLKLKSILTDLKDMGLWGLECISKHHSSEQIYFYMRLAYELGLYPTAGSDFHGNSSSRGGLGIPVAEDFLPWARLGISL